MKNIEKISSLHDDIMVPKATEHLGEYRDYPERFDPKDKSVLTRLEQFGVNLGLVGKKFNKEINELTWDEYIELVGESIKTRYDVIVGSVFDQYMFPNPESPDNQTRQQGMTELLDRYEKMPEKSGVNLIKRKADFKESGNLVLGLEAGAHLINSVEDARELEERGVKIFGFQYNQDTPLATKKGLTVLGADVAKYLFNKNLIVDLAHSSLKTRSDLMDIAEDMKKGNLISYTHGSTEVDLVEEWKNKMGERALKKQEVDRIVKSGGLIGLGVTQPFFASTRKIAERINSIAQISGGIERVAIGTDFGGVPPKFLNDIKGPDDFKKLADALSEDFGMKDSDIDKVVRRNIKDWLTQSID